MKKQKRPVVKRNPRNSSRLSFADAVTASSDLFLQVNPVPNAGERSGYRTAQVIAASW